MHSYRTLLLELEGTLVDSYDGRASAWTRALRNAGYDVPFADVRERIGMGSDRLLQSTCGIQLQDPLGRRIAAEYEHLFETLHLTNIHVLPAARDLLARIRCEGQTLVLTSSAPRADTLKLLEHAQLLTAFDEVVTLPEGGQSKPAPDLILAGLERTRTPASQALVLGDTPYDIAAARAAGVVSIALRSGGWPDAALTGAIAIYRDPRDLLCNFEMSPLRRLAPVEMYGFGVIEPAPESVVTFGE